MSHCDHKNKVDLSQGLGPDRHYYCPKCKRHWYGRLVWREWTEAEWNEYVNEIEKG